MTRLTAASRSTSTAITSMHRLPPSATRTRSPVRAHLNGRSGPKTSNPIVKIYGPGTTVSVVCQTNGSTVGTTSVWNKLDDGNYVSDYYVSTPSKATYSAPLPRCTYPFQ